MNSFWPHPAQVKVPARFSIAGRELTLLTDPTAANSLRSSLEVFIGDDAASSVADAELALEKATASRGLLAIQPNEPDLYGYTDENVDAVAAFRDGRAPLLDFEDGFDVVRLTMAAYLSAEQGRVVDLTDPETDAALEHYVPRIQQGRGAEVLPVR